MTEPLVTIVVATHRRLDYLRTALAGAFAQSQTDFEIIVSDDSASPEIARLAASFDDPRLRYRANPQTLGIGMNHHTAFLEARGRYIANLDDDDVWEPRFLATLVPLLEADPEITVAFCDHHLIDRDGRRLRSLTERTTRRYRRHTLPPGRHQPFLDIAVAYETLPMAMGAVFRKSILEQAPFPPRVGGCYDHWLAYLAARGGGAAYYVPERLTSYRVHAASGSATRGIQNLRDAIFVRSEFLKDPRVETAPFAARLRNSLGVHYGKLAVALYARKRRRSGRIVERHAFRLINRPRSILGLLRNRAVRALFPTVPD